MSLFIKVYKVRGDKGPGAQRAFSRGTDSVLVDCDVTRGNDSMASPGGQVVISGILLPIQRSGSKAMVSELLFRITNLKMARRATS